MERWTTTYHIDKNDSLDEYTIAGTDTKTVTYTIEEYNRKTETETLNSTVTKSRTYTYDKTNWLTQITDDTDSGNTYTIDYIYDNNGNTLKKTDSSLTMEELNYTYDSRNQLVQVTRGPPASAVTTGTYDYNAAGLRIRNIGSERGDVVYYYDGNSVIEERNQGDDSLLASYRYADRLLSLDSPAEGIQYYHHDALGSTVNLTDTSGDVKVSYFLDPYGQIRDQTGTSVNRQVFTGQEHDEQTGLIYFGARYYDPDIARFITQDSYLGEANTPPSLHRYLYAYSNPTVYVDLYGYDVSYAYNWHHKLPQSIFTGNNKDPFIKKLNLELDSDVDINSAKHGRIIEGAEHIGSKKRGIKGVHTRYNEWWKTKLTMFKENNPSVTTLTQEHIDGMMNEMPKKWKEFNRRGNKANLNYSEWKDAKKGLKLKINDLAGKYSKWFNNAKKGKYGNKPIKSILEKLGDMSKRLNKTLGIVGIVAEPVSLIAEQKRANEHRDLLVKQYKVRGYSQEQINEYLNMRYKLEYYATPYYPGTMLFKEDFDENALEYLNKIPSDIIIPDKDLDKVESYLKQKNNSKLKKEA